MLNVNPDPPAVFAVACEPPLTVTALIAIVLLPVPSCVAFKVKVAVPFVGTFVKSISVTLCASVTAPVLPFAKSIDNVAPDVTATSVYA